MAYQPYGDFNNGQDSASGYGRKKKRAVRTKAQAVDEENEKLFERYGREYDDLKSVNPFQTDEAKAIMGKYDLAALYGRDNAAAAGTGANGGNIDSFAAANALRQQAALISKGQEAVLSGYRQKLEHAEKLLSDMGVNIKRVAEEDETAKNNDVARKSQISSVTGYSPDEWVASGNPYMNDDGTLKEMYKKLDFAEIMQKAREAGNEEAYKNAAVARFYKIMGDYGAYGRYDDGDYIAPGAEKTEAARQFDVTAREGARQFDEQIAQTDRALNAEKEMKEAENSAKIAMNKSDNSTKLAIKREENDKKKPRITAAQAAKAIKDGEITEDVVEAYNYYFGTNYTLDDFAK